MAQLDYFEQSLIEKCQTMSELAVIAIAGLKTLAKEGPIHQVCGPMSTGGYGNRNINIKIFNYAIQTLVKKKIITFDQLPYQKEMKRLTNHTDYDSYKHDILENFYLPIFQSGLIHTVYFLPLWNTSKEAIWEKETLTKLATIRILDYPMHWYEEALKLSKINLPFDN